MACLSPTHTHKFLWVGIKSLLPTSSNYCPNKGSHELVTCERKKNLTSAFFHSHVTSFLHATLLDRATTLCSFHHVCTIPTLAYSTIYLQYTWCMQCAKVIVCNNNHVLDDYSCMLVTSHFLMHNILLFNQIDRYS